MSVYRCDYCGSWADGASTRPTDAPRDQYGRIERGYEGPRFCDDRCRDHAEHGMNPDEHNPLRCPVCLVARKGASHSAR